ncbi:hypothetical protein BaRGS_00030408 [Batillaria attramentaria]|uniref:Uncharacterized protein n=1 Tax=Batillaria attramentaria TaxID=370345 RepID=A0ABD0JUF3_9CAEN
MADESDIWEELENSVYIHLASTLSGEVVPPSDDDSDENEPLSALRKKYRTVELSSDEEPLINKRRKTENNATSGEAVKIRSLQEARKRHDEFLVHQTTLDNVLGANGFVRVPIRADRSHKTCGNIRPSSCTANTLWVDGKATCFVWDETNGRRGSVEIATCLFLYLKSLPVTVKDVILYSDCCGGQNRNQYLAAAFLYALENIPNIISITHKYLETGHTQMECDSMHSAISFAKKANPQWMGHHRQNGTAHQPVHCYTHSLYSDLRLQVSCIADHPQHESR